MTEETQGRRKELKLRKSKSMENCEELFVHRTKGLLNPPVCSTDGFVGEQMDLASWNRSDFTVQLGVPR